MAKVLFIQPNKTVLTSDLEKKCSSNFLSENTDNFARAVPSLPAMTVLGALDKNHESYFIDATADNPKNIFHLNDSVSAIGMDKEEMAGRVEEINPDVVFLTSMFTTEYLAVNNISNSIKEKFDVPIIVGGHHAELRPTWHLDEGNVDLVALGEGELNTNDLFLAGIGKKSISDVSGITWKDSSGKLRINPKRYLEDLDGNWEIEKVMLNEEGTNRYPVNLVVRNPELYSPKNKSSSGAGVLYFSRGCPWGCYYCNATERDGKQIRHMSLEKMIGHTKKFIELQSDVLHNEADTFGIHPLDQKYLNWVAEQRKKGKNISLINTNSFFARYFFPKNKFSSERVDLLKRAGFDTITISIESFNPKFNKGKLKGITSEMLRDCFSYIRNQGLNTDLYMMYLFPGQTEEELKTDIKLVEKLSPLLSTTTWRSLTYFPGTFYYDQAIREGKFTEKSYREMIHQGHSFYHLDERFNFSQIKNPQQL